MTHSQIQRAAENLHVQMENLKAFHRNVNYARNQGFPVNTKWYVNKLREAAGRVDKARNRLLRLVQK